MNSKHGDVSGKRGYWAGKAKIGEIWLVPKSLRTKNPRLEEKIPKRVFSVKLNGQQVCGHVENAVFLGGERQNEVKFEVKKSLRKYLENFHKISLNA